MVLGADVVLGAAVVLGAGGAVSELEQALTAKSRTTAERKISDTVRQYN